MESDDLIARDGEAQQRVIQRVEVEIGDAGEDPSRVDEIGGFEDGATFFSEQSTCAGKRV